MREIRFRAWVEEYDEGVMVYLKRTDGHYDFENGFISAFVEDGYEDFAGHEKYSGTPKMTLMQYTGLKDKNGKPIYEGDVVLDTYDNEKGVVDFEQGRASFGMKHPNQNLWKELSYSIEIIGNIWENPELISKDV